MVMRLAVSLGVGRVRLVVVVEDLDVAALVIAAEYVVGIVIRALPQCIEEAVPVVNAAVLFRAERKSKPLGQACKRLAAFFSCYRGKDDPGDDDCCKYENHQYRHNLNSH